MGAQRPAEALGAVEQLGVVRATPRLADRLASPEKTQAALTRK
jgi:hypothetical protein